MRSYGSRWFSQQPSRSGRSRLVEGRFVGAFEAPQFTIFACGSSVLTDFPFFAWESVFWARRKFPYLSMPWLASRAHARTYLLIHTCYIHTCYIVRGRDLSEPFSGVKRD